MAIDDPTALPETAADADEYMAEAERLWHDNRTEDAHVLYHAVYWSAVPSQAQSSLASYRLALYLQSVGDSDGALKMAKASSEPAAHDLATSIRGATEDQVVDPNRPPQTAEACEQYAAAIVSSAERGDWTTSAALCRAYLATPVDIMWARAVALRMLGDALIHLGHPDDARPVLEEALATTSSPAEVTYVQGLLQQIGVHPSDPLTTPTDASQHLLAGISAFERGDAGLAKTELHLVVDDTGATTGDQGRARFYLGSLALHEQRYEVAKVHLDHAKADSLEPERTWAADLVAQTWQE